MFLCNTFRTPLSRHFPSLSASLLSLLSSSNLGKQDLHFFYTTEGKRYN